MWSKSSMAQQTMVRNIVSQQPMEMPNRDSHTYNLGDWVVVQYEGQEYPGKVMSLNETHIQVNIMYRHGKNWRWPKTPDNIFYDQSSVVHKTGLPTVAGRRGQFTFLNM